MIVTLSRQSGTDGDDIAARVAGALGLTVIEREVVRAAAIKADIPEEYLGRLLYEARRSMAGEILDSIGGPPPPRGRSHVPMSEPLSGIFSPPLAPGSASLAEAARAVGRIIVELAEAQPALIVGQGGQALLRGRPGVFHALLVAPLEERVWRVMRATGQSAPAARRSVRSTDAARSEFLARFHNINWDDPDLYHVIINMGMAAPEAAAAMIVAGARSLEERRPAWRGGHPS